MTNINTATVNRRKSWVVVYRTGGTVNFIWHRTMPYATESLGRESLEGVTRMGYRAYLVDAHMSDVIGLPETFGDPVDLESKEES